jgi:twitching motility protein PilT
MPLVIDDILRDLVARDASDLHIKAGKSPVMRIHGNLIVTDYPAMSDQETVNFLHSILNEERKKTLAEFMELDLSYEVKGTARFRVNMFWQRGHAGAVFRVIPFQIRTIDDLSLPEVCKKIALLPRGLVLVTGPTGSGKSTSLAAMIDHINTHTRLHVMTIEDPIEYWHPDKNSIVNQRELHVDTHTFADALRHVMRQNPDVILVGEMRDLETISLAITAAETGHLVFSTLHTVDAAQTMDRIVDVFNPDQQEQIRTQLSVTIQAVISQTLLPRKDITGRIAAFEVMIATQSIRTLIRDGKTPQLYLDIQTGVEHGMQTLDSSLLKLVEEGKVDFELALSKSSNPQDFLKRASMHGLVKEAPGAIA